MKVDFNSHISYQFLKSAFSSEGIFKSTKQVIDWLQEQNEKVHVNIQNIAFSELKNWVVQDGRIKHVSGKFFSIDGINIKTNWGNVAEWDQPIINQPEVGFLGFITKEFDGVLHFLLQAKIEPGNVNYVQLSPTLQATRSNYTQVHQGNKPKYLEYFQQATPTQILLDQLQSEQGARFLRKRNRNIIIKIEDEIEIYDNFVWLTLAQIKHLMLYDNLINMDTRTVISTIPFGNCSHEMLVSLSNAQVINHDVTNTIKTQFFISSITTENNLHSTEDIISFITNIKSTYDLFVERKDLHSLNQWVFDKSEIHREDNKFFKVIAVNVEIGNREVVHWTQPMIQPSQEGLCAFVCKKINGVLHFAVQAKLECGNLDIIELAPTVQCLTGDYRGNKATAVPFLDYVLNAQSSNILVDNLQSEEGGRFFKEQNRNMIIIADDEFSNQLPANYIWMTLNQLYTFLKFNNYLNIQARSLISAISFI
jgi:dTDP-4-dehydro-6-deoxy-alpha-D-glucopyranose 2,3-dehydratase